MSDEDRPTTASGEYVVKRHHWSGSGCFGSTSYKADGATTGAMYGPSPEAIIGRVLGEGSRVRVTVEVLDEVSLDECISPFADLHGDHHRGPDLVAADGTRWFWSEPDGPGGTRTLNRVRWNTGTPYRESGYSAGYRQYGQDADDVPTSRRRIERDHGQVTEVASAAPIEEARA